VFEQQAEERRESTVVDLVRRGFVVLLHSALQVDYKQLATGHAAAGSAVFVAVRYFCRFKHEQQQ
jgi:hypothetical protein